MSSVLRSRVVAVGAISVAVVAVAGTTGAVAGSLVTSADIKNGTIREADLHNSSVGTKQLGNGEVATKDLSRQVRSALAPGLAGYELVYTSKQVDGGTLDVVESQCNQGKVAVGGAVDAHPESIVEVYSTFDSEGGWTAQVVNNAMGDILVTVVVACATPEPQ